jgi:hypothetical protein
VRSSKKGRNSPWRPGPKGIFHRQTLPSEHADVLRNVVFLLDDSEYVIHDATHSLELCCHLTWPSAVDRESFRTACETVAAGGDAKPQLVILRTFDPGPEGPRLGKH